MVLQFWILNYFLKHYAKFVDAVLTAGGCELEKACENYVREKGELKEGGVAITQAYGSLGALYVIHSTLGSSTRPGDLRRALPNLLNHVITAVSQTGQIRSLAMPLIAAG